MGETTFRLRRKNGSWMSIKAFTTKNPLMFIHRDVLRTADGEEYESDKMWTLSHKPSGYAIKRATSKAKLQNLAILFMNSNIPFNKIRSKREAQRYQKEYERILIKGGILA